MPALIRWPQLARLRRPALRLRSLLILIALVAVGPGIRGDRARREERRRLLADPILRAATRGDVARIRELLDQGADVDSVTDGLSPGPR